MASSSTGTNSSGSSLLQNSGSEQDLQQVMDQRKRKRMVSNRESARRSRMRKQQHLDDLIGQVGELRKENNQILTSVNVTTELCSKIEAENSVLRAQMAELSQRLQSLNEIVDYVDSCSGLFGSDDQGIGIVDDGSGFMMNQLNTSFYMNQPILASADMAMY